MIRAVVTVPRGGRAVRAVVCQCGEALTGAPVRCHYCGQYHTAAEVAAALQAAETAQQSEGAHAA